MNQEYFERISDMVKKAQEPLQAIAKLNVETLQNYHYMKPDEFSKVTKPEELLEKQLELAISNGHIALDYMQKSFQILEKAMLSCSKEIKVKSDTKK